MHGSRSYPLVHPLEERGISKGAIESDLVCPRDFLLSWDIDALEAVRMKSAPRYEEEQVIQIARKMDVDEEVVKELSEVCSVKNLYCGDEPKTRKNMLLLKEAPDVNLNCVRHQMEHRKLREENLNVKVATRRNIKYSYLDEFCFLKAAKDSEPCPEPKEKVPLPNVIISVQIQKCLLRGSSWHKVLPSETFNVLGSQTLSSLKDAIKCPMDSIIAGDYSTLPDVDRESLSKSGDLYKSGFFFIENVFYNDLRKSDNKDYSKSIIEWSKYNWPGAELSVEDMTTTKFSDLKFRLGRYYLFTHQGSCEHSVQFQDLRLFTSEDCQDLTLYPVRTVEQIRARKLCQGCTKLSAGWIVYDSPLTPTDPCFLCQNCFKSFLYTPDGEKTSNFKAHHYTEYFM